MSKNTLKALTDISAMNVSFFRTAPHSVSDFLVSFLWDHLVEEEVGPRHLRVQLLHEYLHLTGPNTANFRFIYPRGRVI